MFKRWMVALAPAILLAALTACDAGSGTSVETPEGQLPLPEPPTQANQSVEPAQAAEP